MSELKTYEVVVTVKAPNAADAEIVAAPDPGPDLSVVGIDEYEVVSIGHARLIHTCRHCATRIWQSAADGFWLSSDTTSYYCDDGTHDDPDAQTHEPA